LTDAEGLKRQGIKKAPETGAFENFLSVGKIISV